MVIVNSFKMPESPVRLEQRNVTVVLDKVVLGAGTLFISERTLAWQKDGNDGFSIDYPNVSLHAISKDPNVYEKECIYILTDPHIDWFPDNVGNQLNNEDSDEDDEPDLSELILVPELPISTSSIYEAIKLCQELNPDPADIDDDENLFADAEEMFEPEAQADFEMDNLSARLQNNSVDVQYNYNNGNEDDFEDAD